MKKYQDGFIALIATLILTIVLIMVIITTGMSSFFARFDALGSENKRIGFDISESCVNIALLKISQNYNYNGNETITSHFGLDTVL